MYEMDDRPNVLQFHAGLNGKEVRIDDLIKVGEKTLDMADKKLSEPEVEWV